MLSSYDGAYATPGVRTQVETYENQFWFGRRELQVYQDAAIDGAARDTGNTANTAVLRPGLLMGRITATGKLKQWSPTATDGTQRIFGTLDNSVNMQRLGSNQDRWVGTIHVTGMVLAGKLIIPGNAALGIAGDANEFIVRSQLNTKNVLLVDTIDLTTPVISGSFFGGWAGLATKTADYTVLSSDNNTLFDNRGAAGAVNFTLPTTPYANFRVGFYVVADQSVTVTAASGKLIAYNNAAATSVAYSTSAKKVGGFIEIIGDGTSWRLINHVADIAQVTTVA